VLVASDNMRVTRLIPQNTPAQDATIGPKKHPA
jgi:hypothetical protein